MAPAKILIYDASPLGLHIDHGSFFKFSYMLLPICVLVERD